ncbi:SIMPL domain-containing protein [Parasphingorhabdus sp.]|uniref:SIMPL domain-containing protein n=1 Tax=Parasphingorhabdus sp. TaxID=2709688 RepID=UPI0030A7846C
MSEKFIESKNKVWLASAGLLTIGLIIGGYLLGDGLLRAKMADRSVTVRGLAEREVTADLATWTIAYSAQSNDLQREQTDIDRDTDAITTFTKLDEIKPGMVAEATKDARKSAEQFAEDSGTDVGGIKSATQGYFSIDSRDGDAGGYGITDTPYKKVRVVTTVNFYLD